MKKIIVLFLLINYDLNCFSQKVEKSIEATKNNILNSGFNLENTNINDNRLRYIRIDEYGESYVTIDHSEKTVRAVSFVCPNITDALSRWEQVYKNITLEEMHESINKFSSYDNKIIANNTIYYSGKAVYNYRIDSQNKVGVFSFYIFD